MSLAKSILLINYEYPPIGGGAANATYYMARSFRDLGCNVTVLTTAFGDTSKIDSEEGIKVVRVHSKRKSASSSNPLEMWSFLRHARKTLPALVHEVKPDHALIFFSIPCGLLGPYIKRKLNLNYTVSLRGGDVPGLEKGISWMHKVITPLRRRVLKNASHVVANSKGLAQASEKTDPVPVQVIENGVDSKYFSPREKSNEKFKFLFVGRFQEQKNLDTLISAFSDGFLNSDTKLTLVGDGPLKSELYELAEKFKIQSQVDWRPWQSKDDLRKIYHGADCLVNPSWYEGMPNVVLESMASGVPVIASRIMGHEELIGEKEGFLIDPNNVDELKEKMLWMTANQGKIKEMGLNCRRKAESVFDWSSKAQAYIDLIYTA